MLGRMAAVGYRTARGVIRQSGDGYCRFWHAAPDRWRVENDAGPFHIQDGEWIYIRDPDGTMQRMPQASSFWGFDLPHPWSLFGTEADKVGRFTERGDFSVPVGSAVAVEIAGRRCWEFSLAPPPHKPFPLRVAIDDITGTVLRTAVPEAGHFAEAEEFEPDVDIPDDTFTFDGPVSTSWHDDSTKNRVAQEWFERQQLPIPRWWPSGVGHSVNEGDPDTGAFSVDLEVPGHPSLARWPRDGSAPRYWEARSEGRHTHEWNDDTWHWALAVEEPLSPEDLARVIESMPSPGIEGA
jgi:hypothetical protein